MNFFKWLVVSFCCTVLSFVGFLIATAVCWSFLVSIEISILSTAPFMILSLLFFLCFCLIGERVKEDMKINSKKQYYIKRKNYSAKENNIIYISDKVA